YVAVYFLLLLLTRCPLPPFIFFLLTPPPPRSTLFPYTTLFRSAADLGVNPYQSKLWIHAIAAALTGVAGAIHARYAVFIDPGGGDRKSTRLNSSHLVISYAVFCLKKKKKKKLKKTSAQKQ